MTTAEKRSHSRSSGVKARKVAPKAPEGRRRLVFILGMHRSGTSAITRVVNLAGATLPRNLIPAGEGNPLGHWEPREIVALNDAVLASVGLHWHSLVNMPSGWFETGDADVFVERAAALLRDELPDGTVAVIKDPRLCRLMPLWIKAAERAGWQPSAVLMLRHPLEIAASLKRRNGFLPPKSLMMSLKHTLEAERETRHLPRSIVTYDQVLSDWRGSLERIAQDLGLRWSRLSLKTEVEIEDYVSVSQRHHWAPSQASETGVAAWAGTVFNLLSNASDGQTLDTGALDQIVERLNAAEAVFGPFLAISESTADIAAQHAAAQELALSEARNNAAALHAELERSAERLATGQSEADALRARIGELERMQDPDEIARLSAALDAARAEAAGLAGRLGAVEGERDAARTEAADLAGRLGTVEGERDAARTEAADLAGRLGTVEGERDAARTEAADLAGRLGTVESERDTVRTEAAGLAGRLGTVEGERDAARAEAADLAGRLGAVEGERDAARTEVAGLAGRLKDVEAAHRTALQDFVTASERLGKLEAERDGALREVNGMAARLAEVEASHRAARQEAAASVAQCAELETRVASLSAERAMQGRGIEQLRAVQESLTSQNALQSNKLTEYQERFLDIEKRLVGLFGQIAELERANGDLIQEKERLSQAFAEAERERQAINVPALVAERDALVQHVALLDEGRAELEAALARSKAEIGNLHAAASQVNTQNEVLSRELSENLSRFVRIEENIGLLYQQLRQMEQDNANLTHRVETLGAGLEGRDKQIANLILQALAQGVGLHPEGFDKDFYLTHNPDVLEAVQSGQLVSALEHWLLWGAWEARVSSFRPVSPIVGVDPGVVRNLALLEEGAMPQGVPAQHIALS